MPSVFFLAHLYMHRQALRAIHINVTHFKLEIGILNIKIKECNVTYEAFALFIILCAIRLGILF